MTQLISPVACGRNFESIIIKLIIQIQTQSLGTWYQIVLSWKPQNLTEEKLILG